MTTFETNTKVVHNSLLKNLYQRSTISFVSNCFFSLDGSSSLTKVLRSSIYLLTTPISIFLWKSPEPPWRFVALIISWLKISMLFQVQGIVHASDHLNYFNKNLIVRTNVSNFKMVAMPCIWDQMIPWYGHQTFISTTWKVSTSGICGCGLSSPSYFSKINHFSDFL